MWRKLIGRQSTSQTTSTCCVDPVCMKRRSWVARRIINNFQWQEGAIRSANREKIFRGTLRFRSECILIRGVSGTSYISTWQWQSNWWMIWGRPSYLWLLFPLVGFLCVRISENYKYVCFQTNSKPYWNWSTVAMKCQSYLYFLRSFCRSMLWMFCMSLVASAILNAAVCWGYHLVLINLLVLFSLLDCTHAALHIYIALIVYILHNDAPLHWLYFFIHI